VNAAVISRVKANAEALAIAAFAVARAVSRALAGRAVSTRETILADAGKINTLAMAGATIRALSE
jgi:hypothetical protein